MFEGVTSEEAFGGSTGRGVRVAVVDSGIDAEHPALKGRVKGGIVVGEAEGPRLGMAGTGSVRVAPYDGRDRGWHGTACAGIIAEIAPEAEIHSVTVLGSAMAGRPGHGGTGERLLKGLEWAIENKMHVVNLSLGTKNTAHFAKLHHLIDDAYFQGAILVAAAANDGEPSLPSALASVISVGYEHIEDRSRFYWRPHGRVLFVAAGVYIKVAVPGGGYRTEIGTSFAAPHVTGLVARLLAKHPGLKPFEVKTALFRIGSRYAADAQP